jgi:hypothetical protein
MIKCLRTSTVSAHLWIPFIWKEWPKHLWWPNLQTYFQMVLSFYFDENWSQKLYKKFHRLMHPRTNILLKKLSFLGKKACFLVKMTKTGWQRTLLQPNLLWNAFNFFWRGLKSKLLKKLLKFFVKKGVCFRGQNTVKKISHKFL